jgi:glycosyltransferase involved in cell wall biosynthesis
MKIIIDARSFSTKPSGIGYYAYYYIQQLFDSKLFDITLITDIIESKELKHLRKNGIKIIVFGQKISKSTSVIKYFRFIKEYLMNNKAEFFWQPNSLIPISLKGIPQKIIVTIHDLHPITHSKYFSFFYVIYFYLSLKITLKNVDVLLYNSKETKRIFRRFFKLNKKVSEFISYCIIEGKSLENKQDLNYFLYLGNLERKKGVDILLNAYKIYIQNGGKKKLFIAGKLREKNLLNLIFKINTLNKTKMISYFGYVNKEEKHTLLKNCSCFVFPSRAEGFGMPPLEVMYYSKPIILSNLKIFKELVYDSVNYFSLTNSKKDYDNLCDVLINYSITQLRYNEILDSYSSKKLGLELTNFLSSLHKKGG